ncbi:hypothetical protein NU195Hw_g2143t1 [Hortaea werneckii]
MPRKSERLSTGASKTESTHKRTVSASASTGADAKRSKTKATPIKSHYFTAKDEEDNEVSDESQSQDGGDSEFDQLESEEESLESDDADDYEQDSEKESKSRKGSTQAKRGQSSTAVKTKGTNVWKTGVKAGLGPGNEVVIKKPKARPAGRIPYSDESIHPNTLLFLKELKENNNREWLKMHDAVFRQAEKDWHSFVEKLTERLIEVDDTIPELPYKDVIFRIYRDVRFSPDPTPYKPHFSAAWSRTGRKGPYAHYYVQIAPNESFVGGGLWHPDAAPTATMRIDIDRHPEHIKKVLLDDGIRKSFLNGAPKNESKVVKEFVASNSENALKTKPKGYDADHVDIDLLRLRNYTMGKSMSEEELTGGNGLENVANLFMHLKPFITYINSVVMPDPGDSSEEEDSSGDEDEEDA